jgi:hypothetical protein
VSVAQKFLTKKYHNVSHLKELGIVFIIPMPIDLPGETMGLLMLILHYFNEVEFYSRLFQSIAKYEGFAQKFNSFLRGDVVVQLPEAGESLVVPIVQRYLAKENPHSPMLKMPHVNPEAEHWYKAGHDLAEIRSQLGDGGHLINYWTGLSFVASYFHDGLIGKDEVLISFNLMDLVISLYNPEHLNLLYHQQEALWNKIFIEYLGVEQFQQLLEDNMVKGYITL